MELFDVFKDVDKQKEPVIKEKEKIENPYVKFIEDCDVILSHRTPVDSIIITRLKNSTK